MRKQLNPPSHNKMTVMLIQMEGSEATMQGGFQSFAAALSRLAPQVALPARPTNGHGLPAPTEADVIEEGETVENGVLNGVTIDEGSSPSQSKSRRAFKSPNILLDLDPGTGEMPLTTFLKDFTGDGVMDRYLLIAYWLKHYRAISEFSVHHVHTCLKHMEWETPKDADSPLRDMKNRLQYLTKAKRGLYSINHVGENAVKKLLSGRA
jgi:hypothetical protein